MIEGVHKLRQRFAIADEDEVQLGIELVVLQLRRLTGAWHLLVLDRAFFRHLGSFASNDEQIGAVVDDIVSASTSHQVSRLCPRSRCHVDTANRWLVTIRVATNHVKRAAHVNNWGLINEVTTAFYRGWCSKIILKKKSKNPHCIRVGTEVDPRVVIDAEQLGVFM